MPLYTRIKGNTEYETIGSPTIIDGVATGFSSTDYYKLTSPFTPSKSNWEIIVRVKISSFSTKCTFISFGDTSTRSVQVGSTTTGAINIYLSSNGTSGNIANGTTSTEKLLLNTYYYVLTRFTGDKYEVLVSEDKENWTTFIAVNSSTIIWQGTYFTLGYNFAQYPEPMNGYIDFNETCISIDDIMWFGKGFGRVKIRTSPFITYNVVGKPTITDGIMSDFSVSKYAQIPMPNFSTSNSWEIVCKAKVNSLTTGYQIFYTSSANNPAIGLDIDKDGKLAAAIGNATGSGWLITETGSWEGTKKTVPLETFFWTKLTFNGSRYTIYYSDDGVTWEETIYYNSTSKISYDPSYNFNFGVSRNGNAFVLKGEIDFKETYIKIDDEYYFKGKYKNETWTLCTLNNDYKIENGQLTWANPWLYLYMDQTSSSSVSHLILTDIKLTSASKIITKFKPLINNKNWFLWCNRTTSTSNTFSFGNVSSKFRFDYGTKQNNTIATIINYAVKVEANANKCYINDVLRSTATVQEFQTQYNLILFASNTSGGTTYGNLYSGYFYGMEIYLDGTTLSYKFVPVPEGLQIGNYTVPSNGLFDIVNQQFYPNDKSGIFTYGKDLL